MLHHGHDSAFQFPCALNRNQRSDYGADDEYAYSDVYQHIIITRFRNEMLDKRIFHPSPWGWMELFVVGCVLSGVG